MITVILRPDDMAWGESVGSRRLHTATGRPRWAYEGRGGIRTHILGAQAELAFCRAVGLKWPARIKTYRHLPDVDPFWEVRWSSTNSVKVSTDDPPDQLVVKVRGKAPYFEILGYVRAGGAQQHYPLEDPGNRGRPAHFVPDSRLVPINHGFHTICGWMHHDGEWLCAVCGRRTNAGGPLIGASEPAGLNHG